MLTPGQLQLVADLEDGSLDALTPAIDDETNQIAYPDAEEYLDSTVDELDFLLDIGVLERTDSRDCTVVLSDPHETFEISLDTITLSDIGPDWLQGRMGARQATGDLLEGRGFDVAVNTTVTGESGLDYPVHVHAADDVLGIDIAIGMTETVTPDDVLALKTVAADTGSRPLLVTMTAPDDADRSFATRHDVGVIRADDGSPDDALAAATESAEAED